MEIKEQHICKPKNVKNYWTNNTINYSIIQYKLFNDAEKQLSFFWNCYCIYDTSMVYRLH